MNMNQIETVLDLPHPRQKVWRAVTAPEGISRWFSDRVTLELTPGSPITFEWDEYGVVGGVVETVEPPDRFAYRWRAHGVPEDEPMHGQNSTLVTFELEPTAGGTRLRVVETGFENLRPDLRETAFRENTSGWRHELGELVDYLTGEPA